ncbi:MAG: membrane protein [Pseudonocardiaceae bacterium]|nr:membrane protein [Pseudonocardiaceae bacterium]
MSVADWPTAGVRTLSRRARILVSAGVGLLVLLILGARLIDTYVGWLWFGALGYRDVYRTILLTRVAEFVVVGLFIGGLLALNLALAYRSRQVFVPLGADDALARYRTVIQQRIRLVGIGVPVAVGVIAGLVAQRDWQTVQLFFNSTGFGIDDPEFGHDIGFYAFELPFYQALLTCGFTAVVLSFLGALVTHYFFGGLRLVGRGAQLSSPAKAHLAVLAGTFVLLLAVEYFFDRYELLFSERSDLFTGATYTDLNAVMPAKIILTAIAVICAIAFFAGAFLRNLALPAIATVLLVLSGILVGGVWPALLQQFSVQPNANEREAQSIQRNIEATRHAYGIADAKVEYINYSGDGRSTPARLADETATVSNIRLLDPSVLEQTFTQLQQRENFYGFPDKLDVDRYRVDGELQDYVVALRELETSSLADNQQSWINQHLRYTHGDGFVAARADRVNNALDEAGGSGEGGYPVFTVSDTTGDGAIPVEQPRIYYGELIDSYVIVGGDPGAPPREYELDGSLYTYTGEGGVSIGNWFDRLVFAAQYGEQNILFNQAIGDDSKVIFRQDPRERVEAVAPWLTIDGDPYPAVVDGRIKWIVDGYTTLKHYPYAQRTVLGETTQDTLPGTPRLPDEEISYIRNSVKATVDAYDGTVTLYATNPDDPVLQAWMNVFPGTVQPASEIGDSLRAHFRYPQDLFKVQRQMLTSYHVEDPQVFFSTNDFWDVPSDPTTDNQVNQPPYYVLAGPPAGDGSARFQLTSALVGLQRQFMASYVSVSSAPRSYGDITVLRLPTDSQTLGPQQVQTRFRSSAEVSQELNLLQAAETNIRFGNLLTLPTGDGTLLYVEPVYVERTNQEASFPQLNRVLVLYGDRVGYAASLNEALNEALGSGGTAPGGQQPPPTGPAPPSTPAPDAQAGPEVRQAVADVAAALQRLREARASGDFTAQGEALTALEDATRRFNSATDAGGAPSPGE